MLETQQVRSEDGVTAELTQQLGRDVCRLQARHDKDVRRSGQARERIVAALKVVAKRDVRSHFAFEFEVRMEAIEQLHRATELLDVHARWVAEGRVADEGDAGLDAHAPRERRR